MKNLWDRIAGFLRSEDGPTAVQYALLLLLALLACLTAITAVGHRTACPYTPQETAARPVSWN